MATYDVPCSADSVRFGIQTLAPKFFGSKPNIVISGSNVGNTYRQDGSELPCSLVELDNLNLGAGLWAVSTISLFHDKLISIKFSGAAAEGSKEGTTSIAFSRATASRISYTSLESDPTSQDSITARIYSSLIVTLVNKLLDGPGDIPPSHT